MAQRKRRGGSLMGGAALALGTGAAFAAGLHFQNKAGVPQGSGRILPTSTQLAQAGKNDVTFDSTAALTQNGKPAKEDETASVATFQTIYDLVKEYYVDKLPGDKKMSYGAVRSMLGTLNDPNSFFLEPEQRALFDAEAKGQYAGIGASLYVRPEKRDGYTEYKIVVVSPVAGSPAEKAGLKSGDVITTVNGKWVLGYDPFLKANKMLQQLQARDADADEAALRKEAESARQRYLGGIGIFDAQMVLRGDAKTITKLKLKSDAVTLTVERAGATAPVKLAMTPGVTTVDSVASKTLDGGVGYIKVSALTEKTGEAFKTALAALPANGSLVLDLRGNAGGLLDPAEQIDRVLTGGKEETFGISVGQGGKQQTLSALKATASDSAPVARKVLVLVDKGTASGAEALAAALVDQGAGTLVGTKTFGDASLQALYPLPDGAGFTLTTGKLLGPRKTDWQTKGLSPKVALGGGETEQQILDRALAILKSPQVAGTTAAPTALAR